MAKIKNKLEKHNRKLKINVGNNTFTMDEEEWERLNTFSKNKKMEQSFWQHKEDYDIMKQIDNEIVKQVNES